MREKSAIRGPPRNNDFMCVGNIARTTAVPAPNQPRQAPEHGDLWDAARIQSGIANALTRIVYISRLTTRRHLAHFCTTRPLCAKPFELARGAKRLRRCTLRENTPPIVTRCDGHVTATPTNCLYKQYTYHRWMSWQHYIGLFSWTDRGLFPVHWARFERILHIIGRDARMSTIWIRWIRFLLRCAVADVHSSSISTFRRFLLNIRPCILNIGRDKWYAANGT